MRLDGQVSGYGAGNPQDASPSNLPLVGARVEVHACDAATGERIGTALHRKTIAGDGAWGPVDVQGNVALEFVIAASGYATTHIYRAPFARSSAIVHLRAQRIADADRRAAAIVTLTRPRGYFGVPRDRFALDGQSPAPGVAPGVAGMSTSTLRLTGGAGRAITGEFNGERIVGRAWPAANNELTLLELHH